MFLLEFLEVFEESCFFLWCQAQSLHLEGLEHGALLKEDLVRVVQDGMKCGNDSASIIQGSVLLHVESTLGVGVTPLQVLLLLQELHIADYAEHWPRNKRKELLVESQHFREAPLRRHS